MRPVWIVMILAGALAAGAAGFALNKPTQNDRVILRPDDTVVVTLGRTVYGENCAACHGVDLEGQKDWKQPGSDGLMPAPPHDETGHTWHHNDALLFALTKNGVTSMLGPNSTYKSAMPAYAGILSDEEIVAALSYIKSRWPDDVRQRHDTLNARNKD